jgi:hypothetical protein
MRMIRTVRECLFLLVLLLPIHPLWAGQADSAAAQPQFPEAPQPQSLARALPAAGPCQVRRAGAATAVAMAAAAAQIAGAGAPASTANPQPNPQTVKCPPLEPLINWYARFTDGPRVKPLTPMEKGWLATRNLIDPFNLITILGTSAISVGSNANSPYGPGMPGFARNVGVSFTQDMTGEFVGTFLIPSIAHQDPHYHRMPDAPIPRRALHAVTQLVWTQGDNGKGMLNYANVVGYAIEDEVSNLYVPGRETNLRASAARYGITFASAPIDNWVSEFLPDLASHIHIQVVVIQRIIDQVAKTDAATFTP